MPVARLQYFSLPAALFARSQFCIMWNGKLSKWPPHCSYFWWMVTQITSQIIKSLLSLHCTHSFAVSFYTSGWSHMYISEYSVNDLSLLFIQETPNFLKLPFTSFSTYRKSLPKQKMTVIAKLFFLYSIPVVCLNNKCSIFCI